MGVFDPVAPAPGKFTGTIFLPLCRGDIPTEATGLLDALRYATDLGENQTFRVTAGVENG